MKISLNVLIILSLILCSVGHAWGAPRTERQKRLWAERNREYQGFGIIREINYKSQTVKIENFNWDTNEVELTDYRYNSRFIKVYNVAKIRDLKKDDDVEFFWKKKGKSIKMITKMSLGTMPIEESDLNMDWLEDDKPAASDTDDTVSNNGFNMDWVDDSIPDSELNMDWVNETIEEDPKVTTENIPAAIP